MGLSTCRAAAPAGGALSRVPTAKKGGARRRRHPESWCVVSREAG